MRLRHTLRQLVQRFTGFDIHRYRPTYRYPSYSMDEWSDMSEILSSKIRCRRWLEINKVDFNDLGLGIGPLPN